MRSNPRPVWNLSSHPWTN